MQPNAPGTGYGPPLPPPNVPFVPSPRRTSRLAVSLAALAVVLAAAALVVSLVRKPPTAQPPPAPTTVPAQQLFVDDADKALCQAIAPLMKEMVAQSRAFGPLVPGSPEQGAAIPGYRAFVEGWTPRMQVALNQHSEPPRYLTRTVQTFIDDKLLYVELVLPGRVDDYDRPTWIQGGIDYGGPLGTCSKLGITWS
ncbi:MAG: hypothetical protein QOH57_4898 [Mycobacterium sp.]|nr:hypothetical protein [Mycobacterium sp.]